MRSARLALAAALLLAACFDDIPADPADHPCSQCKRCERCVSDSDGARCAPRSLEAELRCDDQQRILWIDTCGDVARVAEQCSANAECVQPEDEDEAPSCRCRDHWEGARCDVCPPNWDGAQGCAQCSGRFEGDDCQECPDNWDATRGCSACSAHWEGDDCEECPGNWDEAQNCAVCRNGWQGADCETCAPGFDPASDCSTCAGNRTGDDCEQCVGNWDSRADCMSCRAGFVDDGDDCGSCEPGLELNADGSACGEVCGNGQVSASEACDDGNAEPLDGCNDCALGPFRVHTHTAQTQRDPSVAAAADGAFVVVWMSAEQDGDGWGVYGQRFDAGANPVGDEFQVHQSTAGDQTAPQVAVAGDGRFAVVWVSDSATGGVLARRFDAAGLPAGDEFVVFDSAGQTLFAPVIAGARDGRFVIAGTTGPTIVMQTYDAGGSVIAGLVSGEIDDDGASSDADSPAIAMSNSGPLLAYVRERRYLAGVSSYVYSDKVMLTSGGGGFETYAETGGSAVHDQSTPAVASAPTGEGAVTWIEVNDGVYSLRARLLDYAGAFELSGGLTVTPTDPCAAMIGSDLAAFGWYEAGAIQLDVRLGNGSGIVAEHAQRTIVGLQPAMAAVPGGLVLAFASGADVVAQRFDDQLVPVARSAD